MIRQAKRINCISSLYDRALKKGSPVLKRGHEEKYRITIEEKNVYVYYYKTLIFSMKEACLR